MSLADLPPELIQEILEYDLYSDMDALLGLVSTCRYLYQMLWPRYVVVRWEGYRDILCDSNLIKLSVDDDDDSDEEEDSAEEYETDTSDDSSQYERWRLAPRTHHVVPRVDREQMEQAQQTTFQPTVDLAFTTAYTRVVLNLAHVNNSTKTPTLLASFVRRAHRIDNLILNFGSGADILVGATLVRAAAQVPGLGLTVRGFTLTGHEDWQSGPYNPIPAVPTGEVKNKEDYADALRRPRTVDLPSLSPSAPSRISSLKITSNAMFLASIYPLTLSLFTPSPLQALTDLTLHALDLDAFNWSQILPCITLPHLAFLALTKVEMSGEDLVPFLARHESTLTSLDLTHTRVHALTLRLLFAHSLPALTSLHGDPACVVPILQSYLYVRPRAQTNTNGRQQQARPIPSHTLQTLGISFPLRLAAALRAMPRPHEIPPELDDIALRDHSDFHAAYALLARFPALVELELENLRYNGFVEWVLSSLASPSQPSSLPSSSSTPTTSAPSLHPSMQEVSMIDGALVIRRGTVLLLAQWMRTHCPAWRAGRVSSFSQPTDAAVQEMVRTFFSVIFPGMVSLQYKMDP